MTAFHHLGDAPEPAVESGPEISLRPIGMTGRTTGKGMLHGDMPFGREPGRRRMRLARDRTDA